MAPVSAPYPFATDVGGAAEILAKQFCTASAQAPERLVDEIDLGFGALHREFVEMMAVGLRGQGLFRFATVFLVLFHPAFWSIEIQNADYT